MSTPPGPTALVLRALGLGDLLTAVPALRAIGRARPGHRVVLAAPAGLRPVVDLIGAVDDLLPTGPFLDAVPPGPLPGVAGPPDLAVNLHGAGPASTRMLAGTGPRELVAFGVTTPWVPDGHEVARWCRLVDAAGMPADPGDLDLNRPAVPSPAPGAVVVHPGAASAARRWPAGCWAEVAAALAGDGRQVVVTGSDAERPLAEEVAARAGLTDGAVLAGRTGLAELAALVADAALVASNDTGVAHLATAYRVPSVTVFGPVRPDGWGPPDRPQHAVVWSGREGDPFGPVIDPGLLTIPVAEVLAAARGQLAG